MSFVQLPVVRYQLSVTGRAILYRVSAVPRTADN